jgi:hypothetical protein
MMLDYYIVKNLSMSFKWAFEVLKQPTLNSYQFTILLGSG